MVHPAQFCRSAVLALLLLQTGSVSADDLTRQAQADLNLLGYDVGPIDGEYGMKTKLAVGKFQQQHGMPVTGEITFPLVIAISAQADAVRQQPASASAKTRNLSARDQCLQDKQQQAARRARTSKLISAIGRFGRKVVGRVAGNEAVRDMDTMSQDAQDVAAIAKELGINEADAQACLERSASLPR